MCKLPCSSRRGIVGVVVTMAVGLAIGAATVFVGSEVAKGLKKDKTPPERVQHNSNAAAEVDQAFQVYQAAQRRYEQARDTGASDLRERQATFELARQRLERALLLNTPGVSQMQLPPLTTPLPSPATVSVAAPGTAPGTPNPFSDQTVVLPQGKLTEPLSAPSSPAASTVTTAAVSGSAGSAGSAGSSGSSGSASASSPAQGTTFASGNSVAAPAQTAAGESVGTGFEYIKVKSGDSLWKICQDYYGDGGMWQHILKYQIPSIAAVPNLIFPGQLIALPRKVTTAVDTVSSKLKETWQTLVQKIKPAAPGDESWQETFQKDYLISDHCLTDTKTMTVAQIQSFLERKGSVLAKPYRGSSPAKMIFDAAQKHGINPQVLLTRLQCEQGLISAKTATQKRLDWALGVGCYDSGNWNEKFKGLDKQIEYAAATYKRHYQDAAAKIARGEKITMTIDGQKITVKNAATYSFYKYCPHLHGNKLFFDVWRGYRKQF